ncbi:MAG: hypothetical protein R2862_04365 [Thermoanaerobaculia bacterium]
MIEAASSLARLADATGGRNFSIDKALASELEVVAEENAGAYCSVSRPEPRPARSCIRSRSG